MSSPLALEAIVLKNWPYGDKDLIVSLLSSQKGKIRGIAKGAKASKKRFSGTLDLCSHSQFLIRERKDNSLVFIEQASLISGHFNLRKDYYTLMMAMGLLEMADFFTHENQVQTFSFKILEKALKKLELRGAQDVLFWATALEYLLELGIAPAFKSCARCRGSLKAKTFFILDEALYLCENCSTPNKQSIEIPEESLCWMESVLSEHKGYDLNASHFPENALAFSATGCSLYGGVSKGDQRSSHSLVKNGDLFSVSGVQLNEEQVRIMPTLIESHLSVYFHSKPDWSRFLER